MIVARLGGAFAKGDEDRGHHRTQCGHELPFDNGSQFVDNWHAAIHNDSRIEGSNLVQIAIEDPSQPDVLALLLHGEEEAARLYPPESNHHLPLDALREQNVFFHVARNAHGYAIGTGAVVLHGEWAEIKRVWVEPEARGQGLSKAILHTLELKSRQLGVRWLRLETGASSHTALTLYLSTGYTVCLPFGDYSPDPLSVFMEKRLLPIT